ncbi:MarR family winged helix-turn-helix transcriptional regulator [Paucibacter sp. TC2R-5]|uniref:MarR family winged helix-turn-helix transcriptional regulator n=1 Tax=Paucibacter sp. TC2R-5 TaxID=2893555 RepID=UPI002961F462|nr:MarR family winged helix-turn-helix transcriptional regulator [Paucibacter sp. TC2R-5]
MGLDASTLTRNLRPLIGQGWCEQGPGADARTRSVTITAAGRAKHAQAKTHWKRAQLALNQRVGVEQVVALHAMIEQVQAAVAEGVRRWVNRAAAWRSRPALRCECRVTPTIKLGISCRGSAFNICFPSGTST